MSSHPNVSTISLKSSAFLTSKPLRRTALFLIIICSNQSLLFSRAKSKDFKSLLVGEGGSSTKGMVSPSTTFSPSHFPTFKSLQQNSIFMPPTILIANSFMQSLLPFVVLPSKGLSIYIIQ
ncbi:hypothetical protein V8G54_014533 [Vigna mungo]|uniref:Uncharacterized protein n=1 Tax=Vigna mungo TaxID=3915 RepID=A0AAQ3NJI6_VIGMU